MNKLCAKFGHSQIPRTATLHKSFTVWRCTCKRSQLLSVRWKFFTFNFDGQRWWSQWQNDTEEDDDNYGSNNDDKNDNNENDDDDVVEWMQQEDAIASQVALGWLIRRNQWEWPEGKPKEILSSPSPSPPSPLSPPFPPSLHSQSFPSPPSPPPPPSLLSPSFPPLTLILP